MSRPELSSDDSMCDILYETEANSLQVRVLSSNFMVCLVFGEKARVEGDAITRKGRVPSQSSRCRPQRSIRRCRCSSILRASTHSGAIRDPAVWHCRLTQIARAKKL